jgi:hypothetical protein
MMPIDAAGFIEGCFFAPAATGIARVRVVTAGGDGATNTVLGHVTALAYLRGDPSSRCPDVPPCDGGCDVPAALYHEGLSGWASLSEFYNARCNNADGLDQFFTYVPQFLTSGTVTLDFEDTFNGNPSIAATFFPTYHDGWMTIEGNYDSVMPPTYVTPPPDITHLLVFKLPDGMDAADSFFGGFCLLWASDWNGKTDTAIFVRNGHVYLDFNDTTVYPVTESSFDLGSISAWTGSIKQLLLRVVCLSATSTFVGVYLDDPCPTSPTALFEQTLIHAGTRPTQGWSNYISFNDMTSAAGPADPIRLYQLAWDTDPTVFGIPA